MPVKRSHLVIHDGTGAWERIAPADPRRTAIIFTCSAGTPAVMFGVMPKTAGHGVRLSANGGAIIVTRESIGETVTEAIYAAASPGEIVSALLTTES